MKEQHERLMPGKNDFIPGVEITSYFPDPIEICFVGTGLTFTPGIPTEDGWYTITTNNAVGKPFYETIYFHSGRIISERWGTEPVLSHAKLPEL